MLDDLISKLIPPECQEEFEERAAIMEFDGGLSREEAEKKAREIVKNIGKCRRFMKEWLLENQCL